MKPKLKTKSYYSNKIVDICIDRQWSRQDNKE